MTGKCFPVTLSKEFKHKPIYSLTRDKELGKIMKSSKNVVFVVFGSKEVKFKKGSRKGTTKMMHHAALFNSEFDLDSLTKASKKMKFNIIELSEKDSKKFKLPDGKLFEESGKLFIPMAKESKVEELNKLLKNNEPSKSKKTTKTEEKENDMAAKKTEKTSKKVKTDKKDKVKKVLEKTGKKLKKVSEKKDKKVNKTIDKASKKVEKISKKDKTEKKVKTKVKEAANTDIVKFDGEWKVKLTKEAKEAGFELKANNFVWTLSHKKSVNFLNVTFAFTKSELQYSIVASSEKTGIESSVHKVKDQPEHEVMEANVNKNLLKAVDKYLGK